MRLLEGTQSGHWVLCGGRCLVSSAPQVGRAPTVIKAEMNGLALGRAEQREESADSGIRGNINSPGSWSEGALNFT